MPRGALPVSIFSKPDGTVLSNGYILIQLSQDAQYSGAQISSQPIRIYLDGNGALVGGPTFPTNASMLPNNTTYLVSAYTAAGELVSRNLPITVV